MSVIFQLILSTISGVIIGALFFSLWSVVCMYFYIWKHGFYQIELFFDVASVIDKPFHMAFVVGLIIGAVQGLFVGATIGCLKTVDILHGVLIGFVVIELSIVFLMTIAPGTNLLNSFLAVFFQQSPDFLKNSLLWFFPAIVTGAVVTKATKFICDGLR